MLSLFGGGGAAPFHPVDIGGWTEFWDASVSANTLTLSGSDVTTWTGSTGAHNWTDGGAAGQRPSTATINGTRVIDFDGVGEWLVNTTLDRGNPGVAPTYYWGVFLIDTAANFEVLVQGQGGAARIGIICLNASGDLQQGNTALVNTNTNTTIGAAFRLYSGFTGSTADFIQINDTAPTTGGNASTTDPAAGMWLGSRGGTASTFLDGKCACLGIRTTALSAGNLTSLATWSLARYGV